MRKAANFVSVDVWNAILRGINGAETVEFWAAAAGVCRVIVYQ
jgi:hypothetical protein